ncbi:uncharacterized protein LOC128797069 [Vidua chalybeata]|uniref:uncharacterized protein LOC128797069 n=1 Tax=Vidua chalybeata TaxID=81927 RepID=UPI0023A862BC|nr:uncharacterized protein LOC128797069 [Vidua chalybeata]
MGAMSCPTLSLQGTSPNSREWVVKAFQPEKSSSGRYAAAQPWNADSLGTDVTEPGSRNPPFPTSTMSHIPRGAARRAPPPHPHPGPFPSPRFGAIQQHSLKALLAGTVDPEGAVDPEGLGEEAEGGNTEGSHSARRAPLWAGEAPGPDPSVVTSTGLARPAQALGLALGGLFLSRSCVSPQQCQWHPPKIPESETEPSPLLGAKVCP